MDLESRKEARMGKRLRLRKPPVRVIRAYSFPFVVQIKIAGRMH